MAYESDTAINRVLDRLQSRNVGEQTRTSYGQVLTRYFDWCEAQGVHPLLADADVLDRFADHLSTFLRRSTVGANQSALNAFYRVAVEEGVIHDSPVRGTRRNTRKDWYAPASLLSVDAVRAVRAGAARMNDRARAIVDLMLLNGLEVAEIRSIQVESLRNDGQTHWVRVTGRGGAERDIPLAPPVVEPLLAHIGRRTRGPMVVGFEGESINRHAMTRAVKSAARRGGVDPSITPRDLRYTFISLALGERLPLDAVRDYLGVRDIRGLDRLTTHRGSAADVPRRVTQAVLSDAEAGLLDQARRLLDLEVSIHVAAPVVLIGAALEEHLRALVVRDALDFSGTGSIMAYAGALRAAGHLEVDDMSGIDSWARLRNHAAHGDLRRLTRDSAEAMYLGVQSLLSRLR